MRYFILAGAAIGAVLMVWLMADSPGFQEIGQDGMGRLMYSVAVLLLVGGGFFSGGLQNLSRNIKVLAFWIGALLVLVALYSYREEFKAIGLRMAGTLVPGMAVQRAGDLVVARGRGGMFTVRGSVNGAEVSFIFDTGASSVVLTARDARRAGLTPQAGDFTITTMTANGPSQVAAVRLSALQIGSIQESGVSAFVAREGALEQSLLGHTFLDRLGSYEVKGDQLILRAR